MTNISTFTRKALRGGTALQALALLGAGVGAIAFAAPAAAQDYTSGAITGTVTDETGAGIGGATVVVTSTSQGISQTVTTNSSGAFRVNALPTGSYDVAITSAGKPSYRAEGVRVLAGQSVQIAPRLAAADSADGGDIVVTGARAVAAFTGTTTGLNVDLEDLIKSKPVGRDLTSVILLAPTAIAGDSTFGNLPSIGGGSVAENAYYVNGLNLTNFDNYLGGATVPFYFYKTIETKVGGAPAEFGRATGGIVNATTKSGSNDFFAAMHVDWAPNFLRSRSKNQFSTDSSGVSRATTNRQADSADSLIGALEAGGPIIRDKLFVYGLLQFQNSRSLTNSPLAGSATSTRNNDPFWGVKVDAYPIDSQHLEFTIFDTRTTDTQRTIDYSTNASNQPVYGDVLGINEFPHGGVNFVGKYTGRFTDFLTLSAAYGRVRDRFDNTNVTGSTEPYYTNASGVTTYGVPNGSFYNDQRVQQIDFPYTTERKFFRADADLFFNLLGDHHIRGGYDQEKNTLEHVGVRTGGQFLLDNGYLSQTAFNAISGNGGYALIQRAADAVGPIVELNYFNTGGAFKATNKAYYIQDEWKPFDRLSLQLGVRRDDFRVDKPSGAPIANLDKNYAPRVGATYQLFGDKSGKLFGSYSWYYLPIASNTAYRQGAPSFYFRQRYHTTGLNAAGLPILGSLVTNQGTYQTACPFALIPNGATTNCNVTGDGADINTTQAISSNLKATRESEITVGYEQKLGLWTVGLNWLHRKLDRTSEDSAVDAAVNAYCAANNIRPRNTTTGAVTTCPAIWTGFHQYVINNPGKDITVNLLAAGYDINNRTVTLSAEDLGYGKARRYYDAVTFQFNRANDGLYDVGGSYTWSKSVGNSEGFVQSDFGQTDAGITQDFDQPGFVDYSYGRLPNDRTHTFKLFGSISPTDNFTFGLNMQVYSYRPLSCFGYHPTDAFANGYNAASHYCGGQPSRRGTAQRTDWMQQTNIQLRYNAHFADRVFSLRAEVFNLLNSRAVTSRYEFGDLDVSTINAAGVDTGLPVTYIPDPNFGQINGYQAPRYVRLGVDVNF